MRGIVVRCPCDWDLLREVTWTCLGRKGYISVYIGRGVCLGKLEHLTGFRGMSIGGAVLPQAPLIKDNLKLDLPNRPLGSAKPNLLHDQVVVGFEHLLLHRLLYCMDSMSVSRNRVGAGSRVGWLH